MSHEIYDITIIGAGPVGLFTAFYGGLRQSSVKIIESLPQIGGQLSALYPEKYIYDVAGFPKIRAQELVDNLKEQADLFSPEIVLNQSVEQVERLEDDSFRIVTDSEEHYSKVIIITGGNGAFQPRKLALDNVDQFEDQNLHYFVNNLDMFRDQRVVLFGGGDSAVDWALMLEPIAKDVTLVHRRDQFRAHESSVETLMNSNIHILTPYVPEALIGENKIEQVRLQKVKGESEIVLDVDHVLVNYGFISSLGQSKIGDLK